MLPCLATVSVLHTLDRQHRPAMTISFAITVNIVMTIACGSILSNNGVSLGSTVVYFIVLAITQDITMSIAVVSISTAMTISFAITVKIVMAIAGGGILGNNGISLGSTVVYFVVLTIAEDITISQRGTAMAISIITPSLC